MTWFRTSHEWDRWLMESVTDYAIFMLDREGYILTWNCGAELVKDYRSEEIVGRHFSCFYPSTDVEAGKPKLDLAAAAAGGRLEDEGWRVRQDGSRFWANVVITAVRDASGRLRGFASVTRDVSERRRLLQQLEHQALHDSVTGLPNRVLFVELLRQALLRLERHPNTVAVLFLDVDRFKIINDSLGHEAGDQALCTLGDRLESVVRPEDTVARFGGDELVVLCENVVGAPHAAAIAGRIADAVRSPLTLRERELILTASIGVAITSDAATTPERLIADADAAMYRAKERGRGRVELFDSPMRSGNDRLDNQVRLAQGLERGEFRLFFQPVIDLNEGATVGYEALLRWEHPERGLLLPDDFIDLAEETGLIVPLGEWVLKQACMDRMQHADAEDPCTISINVSFSQVAQPDLAEVVARTLAETGTPASKLCLELTESVLMADTDQAVKALEDLKALGVKLAVDDFGTGYSSLSYLQRFPIDIVKIDRSFVANLGNDGEAAAITEAVVRIGEALELKVVAEGVESAAQKAALRDLGCPLAQGFYFSHPQPREATLSA
jgi:diguanylate cyclase (GGDEF)-like protein/PAS domain S-box-containing protein